MGKKSYIFSLVQNRGPQIVPSSGNSVLRISGFQISCEGETPAHIFPPTFPFTAATVNLTSHTTYEHIHDTYIYIYIHVEQSFRAIISSAPADRAGSNCHFERQAASVRRHFSKPRSSDSIQALRCDSRKILYIYIYIIYICI